MLQCSWWWWGGGERGVEGINSKNTVTVQNACFIFNIVFRLAQIEQFLLLKRHFPGLHPCTQLLSPEILCLRAPCRQSPGRTHSYVHAPTQTDVHLQLHTPNTYSCKTAEILRIWPCNWTAIAAYQLFQRLMLRRNVVKAILNNNS